ncbi:MAG TPA: 23S rRNA (adenine(2503)-C(2))-methyltransferase RlmN [Leptospiraceae bacterium]|nr:radical SAM protein [Leptospirales bacterium]HMU83734.1 23S rRNA (adenine(2503)-C(2))-methyltransferase RlmN [Leptospiraceae bacterium]HMX55559.1 23S rRNA (adenine(2503)-C(2))-methyltransferase RlmN [Leptospiraceae bacterium]HMY44526.1 23S rRNA (adenine(2503)-C(2))-methyltransferase RlmN [Leptospiraceae bacterium]HNE23408.1 23S rRNA (adenine(2503)-C(2))-methyltransferase RlmN [Leptospiraceae bacterium]
MSEETPILKGALLEELTEFFKSIGEPGYRGKQAFIRINRFQARTLSEFTEFPLALREKLEAMGAFPDLPIIQTSKDADGTEKAVFAAGTDRRDEETKKIEAVWIVSEGRRTACISSQVGCTLNCAFCATGTMKFRGNLKAWQIVDQVYGLMRHRGSSMAADDPERLTNVVFMGMGEPFYNYDQALRAAHLLHNPHGLNLGARHITISTAGVVPGIERFTSEGQPFNLAISLNHPDPEGRRDIMDITDRFSLPDLLAAVRAYTKASGKPVMFEFVMIPDKNMGKENVEKLVAIAKSVNCKINLIPLNTNLHNWRRPTDEEMVEFQNALRQEGILAFNRGSPGRRVGGACGMLALTG